jgi:hypothetical protein
MVYPKLERKISQMFLHPQVFCTYSYYIFHGKQRIYFRFVPLFIVLQKF